MEQIQVSEQYFGNYAGPLDAKLTPVANLEELYTAVKRARRYVGMTVTVLDDGSGNGPADYWLVGGTAKENWVKKTTPGGSGTITITGDDVN